MIIEIADLHTDDPEDFEAAMHEVATLLAAGPGYLGHTVQRSIESPGRYVLIVRWETVEAHVEGFRQSDRFKTWVARLADHRKGALVEHFETVLTNDWLLDA